MKNIKTIDSKLPKISLGCNFSLCCLIFLNNYIYYWLLIIKILQCTESLTISNCFMLQ
jgi:hypothetical protein